MKTEQKTFAFKLADIQKKEEKVNQKTNINEKWQVRDGVSIAGCTGMWHCPIWGDGTIFC